MLLVGLTGGIGSGKSTVSRLLAERGATVVDADAAARVVVEPGSDALAALVERFGPDILATDGSLDRAALAAKAFATDEGRRALDTITHPAIRRELIRQIEAAPADAVVVVEIQLLVETWSDRVADYGAVIVVEAPAHVRLERAVERGMTREDAARRMGMQATDEERRARATYVLDNSGDLTDLERQVDDVWAELRVTSRGL